MSSIISLPKYLFEYFKKSPVKFFLEGGFIYSDDDANEFYGNCDSELYPFKKNRHWIVWKSIRKVVDNDLAIIDERTVLSEEEQMLIAFNIKKKLEKRYVTIEIWPPFPMTFLITHTNKIEL